MIQAATERDLPAIRALLERLHLPLVGVDDHLPTMLVAKEGEQIDREQVPLSVQHSVEFQSACPLSAIVMRRQLR